MHMPICPAISGQFNCCARDSPRMIKPCRFEQPFKCLLGRRVMTADGFSGKNGSKWPAATIQSQPAPIYLDGRRCWRLFFSAQFPGPCATFAWKMALVEMSSNAADAIHCHSIDYCQCAQLELHMLRQSAAWNHVCARAHLKFQCSLNLNGRTLANAVRMCAYVLECHFARGRVCSLPLSVLVKSQVVLSPACNIHECCCSDTSGTDER